MTAMRIRGFAIVVAAGALVASCGGSSSDASAPSTPKQFAADKATIKQALLTQDDLPVGYSGKPHDNSNSSDPPKAVIDAFVKCSGFPKRLIESKDSDQPNLDAPDFTKGQVAQGAATEVDSNIELDRSANDIREPLALLARPTTAKCFEPFFDAAIKQSSGSDPSVTFSKASVKPLDVGSVGDQSAAFRGVVTVSAAGLSLPVEFNFYFVRSGRAMVQLFALASGTSFDTALAEKLIKTMIDRLDAAK